jgi:hypothetical protein
MQENSGLAAFGYRSGKVWAVALSCTLVCAQPGILPGQAFADPSSPAQPFEASAESYVVGQELNVADSALAYYVTDVDNHKVSVGNNTQDTPGIKNGYLSSDYWPKEHCIEIPKTVTDDAGTVWTVSSIKDVAFRSNTQGYISKFVINADLDYVGNAAFGESSNDGAEFESITWNGSVKEIDGSAFDPSVIDTVEFPEGSLVTFSGITKTMAPRVDTISNLVFPFSSYVDVYSIYDGSNLSIKSPYAKFNTTFIKKQNRISTAGIVYFWPNSNTEADFSATGYQKASEGRSMAIISKDGYSFTAPKSENETGTYSHAQNVKVDLEDGQLFTGAPDFSLKCTGDSEGKYGYDMTEGVDYNAVYFDADGNELKEKPTSAGDYSVQFVGNERSSWGSTDKIKFSIGLSISGAVVASDEDGAAYLYDGKVHAPAIKVTLGNYTLQEGVSYKVSYIGEDGVSSSELPTLPGTYTALVVSEQPSTGGVLGQVKFSIKGYQLEGGALTAANVEADADGNAVAPELTLTTADGTVVPAGAYTVAYKDADGNPVAADDLKAAGNYTVVATGDGVGCFGEVESSFSIVKAGNCIDKAEQDGTLEYNGETLAPKFKVTDKNGVEVPAGSYTVSYADKDGNSVAAADLKEIGTYTATVTAAGSQYVGSTTCEVTVSAQDVADQVEVTLNRSVYDYQSTPRWLNDSEPQGNYLSIARKSKAVDVDATVKLGDKVLQEGVDYKIVSTGDVTSSLEDNQSHKATFVVEMMGEYAGTKASDEFKYTINERIAKNYEYKGVKFSYAVNNDGTAVITGLGVDLTKEHASQSDVAKAYTANWDGETVTIPGTVEDADGTKHAVVAVSDCAFSLPRTDDQIADGKRDIWNGAKKLVIEQGVKEIGYSALPLGTGYCNVEELSLPEGLEVIHSSAFGASKVKSIEIPASVTTIGSGAFGEHNGGNTKLESFTFAKGSKFANHSEGYWEASPDPSDSNRQIQIWKNCAEFLAGEGDHRDGDTLTKEVASSMSSITFPAGYTQTSMLMDRFPSCTDYYFMGDSYPSDMKGFQVRGDAPNQKDEYRMWGWDVENTGLLNVFNMPMNNGKNLKFRPFAVLGNSASDSYTYEEAWDETEQAAVGSKDYAANTFVGTPEVTNHGDEVTVDWNLSTKFVNSDYSWTPEEGTDFTVKYQKTGSTEQVDKITEAGTYTATLTGNGKTCFGTATATVQVDALPLEGANVTVADEGLTYTGSAQAPSVKVTLGEGDAAQVLQAGTDYTVEYVNAVDATDSESKATVRVTGCGLYEGTVDQTFEIAQAPLTVTVANAEKTFGDDDPTFSISSAEGLVGGDSVVAASFIRVKGESAGVYAIACTDIAIKDKSNKRLVTDNYKVTYKDGSLTITGEAAVDISSADVSAIADQTFYGSAVRPAVTVKVGGKELAEGTDYTVTYADNDKVGKATATVTGIGSYAGSKTVEFNVVKLVQFPDVHSTDWFNDSVVSAARAGYMNGYADGAFGPNDTLTRGQAACVLANMADADGSVTYTGQFADVEGSEYYAANVAWAKRTGVMSGYAGTSNFGPVDNLTREQMACTLYNFAKYIDGKDVSVADVSATLAKYSDGNGVDSWAAEAVAWAVENGIMGNGGFINATGEITRAEMAAMAVNYMTNLH